MRTSACESGRPERNYFVSLSFAYRFGNLYRHIVAAEWSAKLRALHHAPDLARHLARDRYSFAPRFFRAVGLAHALHIFLAGTGTRSSFTMNSAFR